MTQQSSPDTPISTCCATPGGRADFVADAHQAPGLPSHRTPCHHTHLAPLATPEIDASRLKVGVIGAGRVGAVLAAALRAAGHQVVAAAGESDASLRRAADLLPGVPLHKPSDVAREADLLLLTVPDDMLPNVVSVLANSGALHAGQVVVHTSGRHGLAVLAPAAEVGARVIALHPAMTFTGTAVDLERLRGSAGRADVGGPPPQHTPEHLLLSRRDSVPPPSSAAPRHALERRPARQPLPAEPLTGCVFGLTAGPAERELAESLVRDLGGRATWVPEEMRTLYHAGLAHGANHLVTLVSEAMGILTAAGVDDPAGTLRPLLDAALDNALEHGDAALTGPIVRGDVQTVAAHLADISTNAPDTLASYVAMAWATLDKAVTDGRLLPIRARSMADVLGAYDDSDHRARFDARFVRPDQVSEEHSS